MRLAPPPCESDQREPSVQFILLVVVAKVGSLLDAPDERFVADALELLGDDAVE